ncbi:alpha/beta hydrolase [Lentimicrobium sp. L6]|uniref:alpha/beta fold hydrolase n=1 Tax=Lentimicrobium sp. L6 TaxID=2735916 RepID=UPI0015561153|nr:alpha/beta hydrolase [Lentimicrobium sp. L6]NPD84936.1 alpha/beta hydrolase [Lentimicrobium sp. L6]
MKNTLRTSFSAIHLFILVLFLSLFAPNKTLANPDSSILYAEITDAKIAYRVYGEGSPIILCTGYATNMDLWSNVFIEALQKHYQVIVFDYRGMGKSSNSGTSFTMASLAKDLSEFMEAIGIKEAHILGWSMGGYVAQMFAIQYPEKLKKLILYATDPGDGITINPSKEIIGILSSPKSSSLDLLKTLFPNDWLAKHPKPWLVLPHATEAYHPKTIGMEYEAVQKWLEPLGGSVGHLHQLKMPVLLICGNKDKVVPCQNSTILHDSIRSSTLINVYDSGHGMMYQIPSTFSSYVLAFLGDNREN